MQFFDTHAHLDLLMATSGVSLSTLLMQAEQANVTTILTVGVDRNNIDSLFELTKQTTQVIYGVGLHPLYIQQHHQQDLEQLERHLAQQNPQCRAVAEIGLDRFYPELIENGMWQKQQDYLIAQLELAKKYQLPVSLHSRQSHDQLAKYLKQVQLPQTGVIHAFSGSYQQAKRFVDLGYKIGVGGIITYQRANKTRQAIAKLSITDLVLETDSPDMPLAGLQGQANHPANIPFIYKVLCELKNLDPEQSWKILKKNAEDIFGKE